MVNTQKIGRHIWQECLVPLTQILKIPVARLGLTTRALALVKVTCRKVIATQTDFGNTGSEGSLDMIIATLDGEQPKVSSTLP